MNAAGQEALRITAELNERYHSAEEVVGLMRALTGAEVPDSFRLFPPFTSDFGRILRFGERVFINSGCRFQDQGGIDIGDGALIGHNAVISTSTTTWIAFVGPTSTQHPCVSGANVTILPGVTIRDGAVVGAGSVVTKEVAPNTVVVGVPRAPSPRAGCGRSQGCRWSREVCGR